MNELSIGIAFAAGLLSFLSPCVLPLVPAYVSYMGGRVVHQVALEGTRPAKRSLSSRLSILLHGLAFVLGFTLVFVTLGIVTSAFLQVLGSSVAIMTDIIARVGGIIIIFFGLHFMGAIRQFFAWLRKHPDYYARFPLLLFLVGIAVAVVSLFVIHTIITLPIGTFSLRLLILLGLVMIFYIAYRTGLLARLWAGIYEQRDALGQLPTSFAVLVLSLGLIAWAFVNPFVYVPVMAIFFLWLFLGRAFDDARTFWSAFIGNLETMLYADTRANVTPTGSSGLLSSFIMGITFSAGWTPCIGPIYGSILQLGAQDEILNAIQMLLYYSAGLGIPFLITAALLDSAQVILRRIQRHMGTIELITGTLLIFVGILVATNRLQSLSANLSPEQIDFSINLEECGTAVISGHMGFDQFSSCMDGTLTFIAINQGLSKTFDASHTEFRYLLHIDTPEVVDIHLSRIDTYFPGDVRVLNADNQELAVSNRITAIDDMTYRVLDDVRLDHPGQYMIVVTRQEDDGKPFTYRLTVRRDDASETVTTHSITEVGLETGYLAPMFDATALNGETLSLEALRGQIVLINFWGTWCGPCRREMPDLQAVYEDYADQGFTILALATNGDTVEDVQAFQGDFGLSFPLIVDTGDIINDQYGVVNRPSTFILDQEGRIVFRHFGPIVASQITEVLDQLLQAE